MIGRLLAVKAISVIYRVVAAPIDAVMRRTRGRLRTAFGAAPVVMLRTTGAKSGAARDVSLAYFTDGADVVLIASNYGQAKHPNWYHNLLKNPQCELFAKGRSGRFVARTTVGRGPDRDRLFSLAERAYGSFRNYAASTDGIRTIPDCESAQRRFPMAECLFQSKQTSAFGLACSALLPKPTE